MTIVYRAPGVIACSFTDCTGSGVVGKRTYYWEFSRMWGPLFTRKDGRELDPQPSVRSNAWKAFEAWHQQLKDDMVEAAQLARLPPSGATKHE